MKQIATALLAFLLALSLAGCQGEAQVAEGEVYLMSTVVSQRVYGPDGEAAVDAVNACLKKLEGTLSLFIQDSEVDRINQNAGVAPVAVGADTFELIQQAVRFGKLSGGRFDITVAPLTKLWGIDTDGARVPAPEEIAAALPLVGWDKIQLDAAARTVYLPQKGMAIDLGGIAKGYLAKPVGETYDQYRTTGALVSIGGNICTYGQKPDGSPYVLGIRDPEGGATDILGKLSVGDTVVSTTGGYERYFERDGVRYDHVLDPATGYPAKTDLLSVTVVSRDGGLSDALSTTLFIAGSGFLEQYRNQPDFQVIVVGADHVVHISDSLRDSFVLTGKNYRLADEK